MFYNVLHQLVVGRSDVFSFSDPQLLGPTSDTPLSNDGEGRIYGVEALVRWRHDLTFAWLSALIFGCSCPPGSVSKAEVR